MYIPLGQENNALSIAEIAKRRYNEIKNIGEKFIDTQLNEKEQELLVLEIVTACIQYSEEHNEDFEEVLGKLFIGEASIEFSELMCKTMKSLHTKGYIEGIIEASCIPEFGEEILEESILNSEWTRFENISISTKGKVLLSSEAFKNISIQFMERAKPIIQVIAIEAIKIAIKNALNTMTV